MQLWNIKAEFVKWKMNKIKRKRGHQLGIKLSKKHKIAIGKGTKGNKSWLGKKHSAEWKEFAKNRMIGNKIWKDKKHSEKTKERMRLSQIGIQERTWKRIMDEIQELEKQGFRCIPITCVIPDIIATRDGKIYAIEVEYRKPNYVKYNKDNYKDRFDDVIWLLRNNKK